LYKNYIYIDVFELKVSYNLIIKSNSKKFIFLNDVCIYVLTSFTNCGSRDNGGVTL